MKATLKATLTVMVILGFMGLAPFSRATCASKICLYTVPCSCGSYLSEYVACGQQVTANGYYTTYTNCVGAGDNNCHAPEYDICLYAKNNRQKFGKNRIELAKRSESCGKSVAVPHTATFTLDRETLR